ncbi:hypothetical protein BH20BAC1_BH20BAC1_08890 [soil metagenome]
MKTKLTLNIEDTVVKKTKMLSRQRNKSISAIVEEYLEKITSKKVIDDGEDSVLDRIRKYTRPIQLSDEEAKQRKNEYLSHNYFISCEKKKELILCLPLENYVRL